MRYIDAEALDNRIKAEWARQVDETKGYYGLAHFFVETQPTADVAQVVHAHWMTGTTKWGLLPYQCSACKEFEEGTTKYCPDCGAKMDEEENKKGGDINGCKV